MSDTAIRVENLGKRYRIGKAESHANGRRSLRQTVAAPFRYLASTLREPAADEIFWALKDVSFEVKRGEVVGIIGRNGAGKSTLLKILSRITEPTEGYADIYGRVGSLLEVGTGFHPELTGRENIYLSGTILGMKKWEIDRRFDEIVAFAEIEKFIDTPVKRYSSGMYVRLAFAVAAHLEPEILLVDEVLAVGDVAFQKKCLGKMGDVAKEGRTVLFVSHNMTAVEGLCTNAVVLRNGSVDYQGDTDHAITHYLRVIGNIGSTGKVNLSTHPGRRFGSKPVIREIRVLMNDTEESSIILVGSSVVFDVHLDPGTERYGDCALGFGILSLYGQMIVPFRSKIQSAESWSLNKPGNVRLTWNECVIAPGLYRANVAFSSVNNIVDWIDDAFDLEVRVKGTYGIGKDGHDTMGIVVPKASWRFET